MNHQPFWWMNLVPVFIWKNRWEQSTRTTTGWWFGTMELHDFPFDYGELHNPNWLIFFRGWGQRPTRSVWTSRLRSTMAGFMVPLCWAKSTAFQTCHVVVLLFERKDRHPPISHWIAVKFPVLLVEPPSMRMTPRRKWMALSIEMRYLETTWGMGCFAPSIGSWHAWLKRTCFPLG